MARFYSAMAGGFLLLAALTTIAQERIDLNSSQNIQWKLTPQDDIGRDSALIYKEGYDTKRWVPAVVPGCVFTSYVQAGLEKDPNFGDNIYQVDQKKYNRNFWYRTEFATPALGAGKTCRLHFKGINRKGEVSQWGKNRVAGWIYGTG